MIKGQRLERLTFCCRFIVDFYTTIAGGGGEWIIFVKYRPKITVSAFITSVLQI